MNIQPISFAKAQQGVAMLEALIAVLLFSFGILALVGLQASSMRITTDAKMRIDASYLANQKIGEMWADLANFASHAGTVDLAELPSGKMTTVVAGDKVTVTVTWKTPSSSSTNSFVSIARINNNGL